MIYMANLSAFILLCLIPIQISAYFGSGIISVSVHILCIILSMIILRARPSILGTKPEYITLVLCVTNALGLIANIATRNY